MTKMIAKLTETQNKELVKYFEDNYEALHKEGILSKTVTELSERYGIGSTTLNTNIVGPIGKLKRPAPKIKIKSGKNIITYTDEECMRLKTIFETLNSPARNIFYEYLKNTKILGERLACRATIDRALERAGINTIVSQEKQLRKEKVIKMWKLGNSIEVISRAVPEITEQTIKGYLRESGVSLDTSATTEFKKEVIDYYYEFGTDLTIKEYAVPQNTQSRWRKELSLEPRDNGELYRIYDLDETFFNVIDKESKAHHLGLYATDGNVTRNIIGLELQRRDGTILDVIKNSVN